MASWDDWINGAAAAQPQAATPEQPKTWDDWSASAPAKTWDDWTRQESTLTKVGKFFTGGKDDPGPDGNPRLTARRLGGAVVEGVGEGAKDVVPGLRAASVLNEDFFNRSSDDDLIRWHQTGANPASHLVDQHVAAGTPYAQAIRQGGIDFARQTQQGLKGVEQRLEEAYPQDPAFKGKSSGLVESGIMGTAASLPAMALAVVPGAGPALSIGAMTAQQAGSTFKEQEASGADPVRAARGAMNSAIIQAPIEYLGNAVQLKALSRAMGKSPLALRLLDLGKAGLAEGIENTLQGIPEDIANAWITNPDKTLGEAVQLAAQDPEKFQRSWERFAQGAIGGVALQGTGQAVGYGARKVAGVGQGPAQAQAAPQAESLHAMQDQQEAAPGEPGSPPPAEPTTAAPGARPLLDRIVGAESSGDPNAKNPNSTARGLGQMVKGTRDMVLERSGLDGYSKDPAEQRRAAEWLLNHNREQMAAALGRDPTDAEQYMGYFLGPQDGVEFIGALATNPEDTAANHVKPAAARSNPTIFFEGDRPRTLAEVFDLMGRKVGQEAPGRPQARADAQSATTEQGQPQAQPEGALGTISPELAALRQDIKERNPEISAPAEWEVQRVQEAAGRAAGVPLDMTRENELRSLRADIQAREVQQRAMEEQGAVIPPREAARLGQTPALPQGQGFELQQTPGLPPVESMPWRDLVREGLALGIPVPMRMPAQVLRERVTQARAAQMRETVQAPNEMRVQFRPEARTPEQFPDADQLLGQSIHFSQRQAPAIGLQRDLASRIAGRLQAQAPGAAPIRVISRAEIPQDKLDAAARLGHRDAASRIEGWTDHRTGEVVLVHDNLESANRAVEVWMHEQGAHHGLRGLLGEDFARVMTAVRNNLRLKSLSEAEEAVARIAEKLDAGQALTAREGFTWRTVVDAVRTWLARRGIVLGKGSIESMLRQSLRRMAQGGQRQAAGQMQEAEAFSQGPPLSQWTADVDRLLAGRMGRADMLRAGDTPAVLRALGAPDLPVVMTQDAANKVLREKHMLPVEMVKQLPGQLENPVAVFDSATQAGELVVLTEFQHAGKPVIAAVHLDRRANSLEVNRIASLYGKDNFRTWLASQIGQNTRYYDKKKLLTLVRRAGLQLPGKPSNARSNVKILTEEDIVNSVPVESNPDTNFSLQDATLSDYQRERLSEGSKSRAPDLRRALSVARMLFTGGSASASDLVTRSGGRSAGAEFDMQFRRQAGLQGIVHDMVAENGGGVSEFGIQGGEMNVIPGSKTLMQILAPLAREFQLYLDFNSFMLARREVALAERNEKSLARVDQIRAELRTIRADIKSETDPKRRAQLEALDKALVQEGSDLRAKTVSHLDAGKAQAELQRLTQLYGRKGVAQFEAMHKELVTWLDQAVLKPRLDSGLLSREAYNAIVNAPEHEVYTAFQREIERDGSVAVGGRGGPKRIKGSERKIIMPVESALAAAARTVQEVEQAKTIQLLVDARNLNPEIAEVITPARAPGRGTVTTYQNGVAKHWNVPWEVAAGLNGLSPVAARVIRYVGNATLLRPSAQLLRMGTTLFSLAFSMRNVIRDQIHATTTSAHGYNPLKFIGGMAEYLKDATGKDSQVMQEWRRAGGETGIYTAMEQSMVELSVAGLMGFQERTAAGEALRWASSPFRAIRWIGEAGEKATRVALYQNARAKGATAAEAMLESRDSTVDFSRVGLAGQVINQIIPFWNANVQGLSKMVRTAKERPGRFALNVLLGITAPSLLEWAAYHDEDWWKNLEAWEKDLFWHVKAFGTIFRIPKPFEVGVLFGSLPTRVLEWWETNDANGMWKVGKAIKDGMTPPLSNPLITPLLENYTNHSFFSGRPLESRSMESLQPWMRYNTGTSELAKMAGRLTDVSPIKIDNWIRGLAGTVGRDISKGLDAPVNWMRGKDAPPAPAKTMLESLPGVSGFVTREPIGSRSEPVNDFYTNLERVGQAAGTMKAIEESGNRADLGRVDAKDAFFAPGFKKVSERLSDARKEIAGINESMAMTPEAKRSRIDTLERQMTRETSAINEAYNRDAPTPEALFYGVKARITAAKEAYAEANRAGDRAEALRILDASGLRELDGPVRGASGRLAEISKARTQLENNRRMPDDVRARWAAKLDEQEAKVLETFKSRVGGRR